MNELVTAGAMGAIAIPNAPDLSRAQKAAIILSLVDPADAAEILKELSEDALLTFARAVSELKPINAEALNAVVIEFLLELGESSDVRGGVDQVRAYLSQFMEAEAVDNIINDVMGQKNRPIWDRFAEAPMDAAVGFLELEHPQTIAVVLGKLRSDKAAQVLELLDEELARNVVMRMSRVPTLDPETLTSAETAIDQHFLSAIQRQTNAVKPAELIGNLMNNVGSEARDKFLAFLEESDSTLASEVTRVMFTFADITTRVPTNGVAGIIKDVEEESLLMALRHARDTENPSYDFIMSNISKRMAERFGEDIEAMEAPKEKDAEAAQMEIVNIIQRKAKMGEIQLYEPDPE